MNLPGDIEPLSEECRKAVRLAGLRARKTDCRHVEPIHLMLEILSDPESRETVATYIIRDECPDAVRALAQAEPELAPRTEIRPESAPELSAQLVNILRAARLEREARGNHYLNRSHVTVALLQDRASAVRSTLQNAGLDIDYVVRYLRMHTGRGLCPEEYRTEPKARRITLEELSEELQRDRDVREWVEFTHLIPDNYYQLTHYVQIAHGRKPKSSGELTHWVIEILASQARQARRLRGDSVG